MVKKNDYFLIMCIIILGLPAFIVAGFFDYMSELGTWMTKFGSAASLWIEVKFNSLIDWLETRSNQ